MAIDITAELTAIESATYGEQVRGSIHDGIQKIANSVNSMENTLTTTLSNGMTSLNDRADAIETTLDAEYQAVKNEVDASNPLVVRKGIAPMYDTSNTSTIYNVGDYVYHTDPNDSTTNTLWKCQTATTGGIAFPGTPPNWIQATFAQDVSQRIEVNQFRFDSAPTTQNPNPAQILTGKSCNDLTTPSVWFINNVTNVNTLTDFPLNGPGWIRISAPNTGRVMQEVYPADPSQFPYRLFRAKNTGSWSAWYKIAMTPLNS